MTNEEIRIKIAESLGWNPSPLIKGKWCHDSNMSMARNGAYSVWVGKESLPNYSESLDACAEFEKTLVEHHGVYWFNLAEVVSGFKREEFDYSNDYFLADIACATARQRCLAYLKTKGLIP